MAGQAIYFAYRRSSSNAVSRCDSTADVLPTGLHHQKLVVQLVQLAVLRMEVAGHPVAGGRRSARGRP